MAEARDGWKVLAASLAGTSHLALRLPCQDAHGWRELPEGRLIAAVADGAGSAPRSDEGAALAVAAALEALAGQLSTGCGPADGADHDDSAVVVDPVSAALRAAFAAARAALLTRAAAEDCAPRELACTLALAVLDSAGLTTAQVGDGVVLAQDTGGVWRNLLEPQKGEYANEVLLLTAPEALARLSLAHTAPPAALVMSTDGLIRLMLQLPSGEPHPAFLDPLVAFARGAEDLPQARRGLLAFLGSERVCARTDDDKTLLVALPAPQGPAGDAVAAPAGGPPVTPPPVDA